MISAEHLQDAIGLLPDELLFHTDALRQQKQPVWKPVAAVAASLLLVAGLYQLQPAQKSAENGKGMADAAENIITDGLTGNSSFSEHSTSLYVHSLPAKIMEVHADHLVVTLPAGESAKVFFDNLEEFGGFSVGDEITLCFTEPPKKPRELYPNEILIH